MPKRPIETFACPHCGARVRTDAACCPECGSDEETGWSEDTMYDDLDLPDPGWGQQERPAPGGSRAWTIVVVIVVAALIVLGLLGAW